MVKVFEGNFVGSDLKVGIVVGRFNDFISKELLDGALDCLARHGVKDGNIEVAWVPGALEIAPVAKRMANNAKYNVVICLGSVIKGATPHFEFVSAQTSKGISQLALDSSVPIIFGVLTTDNIEQAIERAGTKSGNKGWAAAMSAIETANLYKKL